MRTVVDEYNDQEKLVGNISSSHFSFRSFDETRETVEKSSIEREIFHH